MGKRTLPLLFFLLASYLKLFSYMRQQRIYSLESIFNNRQCNKHYWYPLNCSFSISSKQINVENILLHYLFRTVYSSQVSQIYNLFSKLPYRILCCLQPGKHTHDRLFLFSHFLFHINNESTNKWWMPDVPKHVVLEKHNSMSR